MIGDEKLFWMGILCFLLGICVAVLLHILHRMGTYKEKDREKG